MILTLTAYSPEYEATQRKTNRIVARLGGPQSRIEMRYAEKPFSYPRAMNMGMDAALSLSNWEWLVLLDADGIFVSMETPPETGFGTCRRYDQLENEPEAELLFHSHWTGSSYFILHREIVKQERNRFCPEFEGYGWDDADFNYNVVQCNGHPSSPTDAKSIHLWHPCRSAVNPSNHALYLRRFEQIHGGPQA